MRRIWILFMPLFAMAHEIPIATDSGSVEFQKISVGLHQFVKIEGERSLRRDQLGLPEIPRLIRWVAVDPSKNYKAEIFVEKEASVHWQNIHLYPVQPDTIDRSVVAPFVIDHKAYRQNTWFGSEMVHLRRRVRVGSVTLLTVEITPFQYNPRHRILRLVPDFRVRITPMDTAEEHLIAEKTVTKFVRNQISILADNAEAVLGLLPEAQSQSLLVVTNPHLETLAKELTSLHESTGISADIAIVPASATPENVKEVIQARFRAKPFDAVLLFGNEQRIPLYYWNGVPGDVYYSLLSGDDNVADISVGRFPVADRAHASFLIEKTGRYIKNILAGSTRKDVMLVAHGEDYPRKYTANQEMIYHAANPLGLQFNRQYGGAAATNNTLLAQFPKGFGIINYRGHGSATEWWVWGKDGNSFTETQIDMLNNDDRDLAIYFNIACDTGAIQDSTETLSESLLFRRANEPYEGAVAVVASTEPSYTETNHRFDIYLFEHMQKNPTAGLGDIFTAANNRLVQDESGVMPENVKMYLLMGHPLLPMPYSQLNRKG